MWDLYIIIILIHTFKGDFILKFFLGIISTWIYPFMLAFLPLAIQWLYNYITSNKLVKNCNEKIVEKMMDYLYYYKKFDNLVLKGILNGVANQNNIKIEKLKNEEDFRNIIIVKLIENIYLDREDRSNLINEVIQYDNSPKNYNEKFKENEIDLTTNSSENSKSRKDKMKYLYVLVFIYFYMLLIITFFVIFKSDIHNYSLLTSNDFITILMTIVTLMVALSTLFLIIRNYFNKD